MQLIQSLTWTVQQLKPEKVIFVYMVSNWPTTIFRSIGRSGNLGSVGKLTQLAYWKEFQKTSNIQLNYRTRCLKFMPQSTSWAQGTFFILHLHQDIIEKWLNNKFMYLVSRQIADLCRCTHTAGRGACCLISIFGSGLASMLWSTQGSHRPRDVGLVE